MSDLSAWLLSIGAFAAIVVCTAVAAKSIAGDPPRGRRRCPRCWHELGPTGLRCAECGHEARGESDVTRNRRQPVRAALAILAVVAVAAATRVRLLDRGAWSMAPTSVLLWATPSLDGGGYRSAAWELAYRVRAGTASDAQVSEALGLFIAGDDDARPPSASWRAKYRDLGSAVTARLGPGSPELLRLLELPPAYEVAFIDPGPDAPPLLVVDADVWWPPTTQGTLEIGLADGSTRTAAFHAHARFPPLIVEMPAGTKGGDKVTLALSPSALPAPDPANLSRPNGAPGRESIDERVEVTLPPSAAQPVAWTGIDSEELRRSVAEVFGAGLIVWGEGAPRGGLRFDHRLTAGEEFAGTAIGLRVEVLEAGVVRRTSRMWWMAGERGSAPRWLASVEDAGAMARLADPSTPLDAWTLRITGDERLARYAASSRRVEPETNAADAGGQAQKPLRWFSGAVEVPLRVERNPTPAPARRWRARP